MKQYDMIIAGAGSVGVPIALSLGEMGYKVLVLDQRPSPGQGDNKSAIGGIRATHSEPAKIIVALRSLEIFSTWQERYGDDIEWLKGGYLFPVFREKEERALKGFLSIQKQFGLNVDFISPKEVQEVAPGIVTDDLRGGTFSPDDGSASPLLAINAFYQKAVEKGVVFRFNEKVETVSFKDGQITGVVTRKGRHSAPILIETTGAYSRDFSRKLGIDMPVTPDSHEGGITEPVASFFKCMIVDLRPGPGSKNYYFYQNLHGQVVFCITPDPAIVGRDRRETSVFLPQVSARMLQLMPRLKNLRVRRVWRGLYPMSPDGSPLVGWSREIKGLFHATGMCGQGFMLGPGLGEAVARAVVERPGANDKLVLDAFSPDRPFEGAEALK